MCNVCIDDFESEIIEFSKLINAKETIIKFKNSLSKDEFCIDFNVPFSEQLDALAEDVLQVEYPNNYLLDIG